MANNVYNLIDRNMIFLNPSDCFIEMDCTKRPLRDS